LLNGWIKSARRIAAPQTRLVRLPDLVKKLLGARVPQAPQLRLGSLFLCVSAHSCGVHKPSLHFFPLRRATPNCFTIVTVIASRTSSAGLLFIM
jgi:hypothetical protein